MRRAAFFLSLLVLFTGAAAASTDAAAASAEVPFPVKVCAATAGAPVKRAALNVADDARVRRAAPARTDAHDAGSSPSLEPSASPVQPLPEESPMWLFLTDDSDSMTRPARAPERPMASRWDIVLEMLPKWLDDMRSDALVGARAIGGRCGGAPSLNLPVGSSRADLLDAVRAASPSGKTNLNAALKAVPDLFPAKVEGERRLVLFTDGLNTCPPQGSTCDLVRELHEKHNIRVDVVAWVTSPKARDVLACVAQAGGGRLWTPNSAEDWGEVAGTLFQGLNPMDYVIFVLGLLIAFVSSVVAYRHGFHVRKWRSPKATLAAGLAGLGVVALVYLILFFGAGAGSVLLALLVALLVSVALSRRKNAWAMSLVFCASVIMFGASPTEAASVPAEGDTSPRKPHKAHADAPLNEAAEEEVEARRDNRAAFSDGQTPFAEKVQTQPDSSETQGRQARHHVLSLDLSGSVRDHMPQMKSLLARYGSVAVQPGDEITLFAFGLTGGSVRDVATLTVPPSGSTRALKRLLDDVDIPEADTTCTYFRPLADAISALLRQRVRKEPVVLTVSDGDSDASNDGKCARPDMQEVSFEALGDRRYRVPGTKGLKVAVSGAQGLDLSRLSETTRTQGASQGLLPPIDPCLLQPDLNARTNERLRLTPQWWHPFGFAGNSRSDTLEVTLWHECDAARQRSFAVRIERGGEVTQVASKNGIVVEGEPRTFQIPVALDARATSGDGIVRIHLRTGSGTRTIYPQPSRVEVTEASWREVYGWTAALLLMGLLLVGGGTVVFVRRRRAEKANRPLVVRTLEGGSVRLRPGEGFSLGGPPCDLELSDVPEGTTLARAERPSSDRDELQVRPSDGIELLSVGGTPWREGQPCPLGRALRFEVEGQTYEVTLFGAEVGDSKLGVSDTAAFGGDGLFDAPEVEVGVGDGDDDAPYI